jgi:hypothetical protein
MSPNLTMTSDGKKFMWDGRLYDTGDEASRKAEAYEKDDFEVRIVQQDGKSLVYTRRTIKEVVATEP